MYINFRHIRAHGLLFSFLQWITCAVKATKILCCHWLPAIGNCILLFLLIGLTAVLKIVIAMATRIEDDVSDYNMPSTMC